jgi:hypothetical protein
MTAHLTHAALPSLIYCGKRIGHASLDSLHEINADHFAAHLEQQSVQLTLPTHPELHSSNPR